MSLLPLLFSDWYNSLDRPHRIFQQHFGLPIDLDDVELPSSRALIYKPSSLRHRAERYHPFMNALTKRIKGSSSIVPDKDNFVVALDVQQFLPEEIKVKVVDDKVVVEAKHEEKEDDHGWISREFKRSYLVPNQCDIDKVETHLSSDGILKITVPKKELPKLDSNEKIIKIQYTGEPAAITSSEEGSLSAPKTPSRPQRQAAQNAKNTVKAA